MRFGLCLVLHLFWLTPLSAASLTLVAEFNRGAVREVDVAGLQFGLSEKYVAGAITQNRDLLLFVFSGTEESPRARIELGQASALSLSPITDDSFVVAVRDSDGLLRVIGFQVSPDGRGLTRLGTAIGPAIKNVKAAYTSVDGVVRLAGRTAGDQLFVRNVTLQGNGDLRLGGALVYGGVREIALADGVFNGLVMRTTDNAFRLTAFLSGGSNGVLRGGTASGGSLSDQSIASTGASRGGQWVTATSSGNMITESVTPARCIFSAQVVPYSPVGRGKLIAWEHDQPSGNGTFSRDGEVELSGIEGLAHKIDIVSFERPATSWVITGHLGYDAPCSLMPRLYLHLWHVDDGFDKLATKELDGRFTDLAMTTISGWGSDAQSRVVVALRGFGGDMKLSVWDANRFD